MAVVGFLSRWIVASVCAASLNAAAAATVTTLYDLEPYMSVDVELLDAGVELELYVDRSAASGERVHFKVEGDAVAELTALSGGRPEQGLLRLGCASSAGTSAAISSFGKGLGILWLPAALMLVASPSLRQSPVAWMPALLALALSPSSGQSTCQVRVTLVAPGSHGAWLNQMESRFGFSHTPLVIGGRPYSTEHGSLLAPLENRGAPDSWCSLEALVGLGVDEASIAQGALPNGWDEEVAAEVAREWSSQGQEEHASVASFARFSLELLRFAAPPQLLTATHQAAVDEVKHARQSFALASWFNKSSPAASSDGSSAKIGAFPVETVQLSPDIASMARRTFEEGCEGESAAVARLAYAVAMMSADSPARMPVAELLADEARHAALAWATVRWALKSLAETEQHSAESLSLVQVPSSHDGFGHPEVPDSGDLPVSLVWGGRIPEVQAQAIARAAARDWVQPWMEASRKDVTQPLPQISSANSAYGEAVAKAAEIVRQELGSLETSLGGEALA